MISHQTGTTGDGQTTVDPFIDRISTIKTGPRPLSAGRTPARTAADTSSRPASSAVSALCPWSTRLVPTREPSRVPWKPGAPTRPDRPRSDDGGGVRPRAARTKTIPSACHAGFRLPRPLPAIGAVTSLISLSVIVYTATVDPSRQNIFEWKFSADFWKKSSSRLTFSHASAQFSQL